MRRQLNIILGSYDQRISPEVIDLLCHVLEMDVGARYDLVQIAQHPWMSMVT